MADPVLKEGSTPVPVIDYEADSKLEGNVTSDVIIPEDAAVRADFDYKTQQKLLRKIDLYVMPMLILAYLLKNMDGNAISYIKTMNEGTSDNVLSMLHMTTDQYAWLSTIFSIPFILVEIPSNLAMKWSGPRLHFCRIIVLWSIAAMCQAAAKNFAGIMTARFFLGLFEGGLYPGIIVFLTSWYRPDEIAVRIGCVDVLGQFSGIFNALISFGLVHLKANAAAKPWQVLFIIEGGCGLILVVFMWFFLPDYPDTAKFLTEAEREFVQARLPPNAIRGSAKTFSKAEIILAAKEPTTYAFMLNSLVYNTASYGYQFWLPSIITSFGLTGPANSQLLNIPPALIYFIGGVGGGYINEKCWMIPRPIFMLFVCAASVVCFALMAVVTNNAALYAIICIVSIPIAWNDNILVSWRTQSLKGASHAAVVFAFQNAYGQLAGFYTAQIFQSKYAPRFSCGFFGLMMVMTLWLWRLTWKSERDTRLFAARRHKLGKETGEILKEDYVLQQ